MDSTDIGELRSMLARLDKVSIGLRSWSSKERTWDESRTLIDNLPLRIFSLEDRTNESRRIFLSETVTDERKRQKTFAELVTSTDDSLDVFLLFINRSCVADQKSTQEELRLKLIDEAKSEGRDIDSQQFFSEVSRKIKAVAKTTQYDMIRKFFTDAATRTWLTSRMRTDTKFVRGLARAARYGRSLTSDDLQQGAAEIVRKLISYGMPITLEELGMPKEVVGLPDTEQVTRTRPILNAPVADEILQIVEREIRRIRLAVEQIESDRNRVTELPFEIFPPGEWDADDLIERFRSGGIRLTEQEIRRLEVIKDTFKPDRIAVGKLDSQGYRGYFVFIFDGKERVIAENPLYGNATYIIKGKWEEILKVLTLSKSEVRRHPQSAFVVHREKQQWLQDLRLKFRF